MKRISIQQKCISRNTLYNVGALLTLILLGALYIYFVCASVFHVVLQQEVERKTDILHSEIATLETKYIRAQHAVSEDIASRNGYVAVESKIFLNRSAGTVASSRTGE